MGPVWLGGECSGKSCARVGSLNYRFSVSEGDKDIEGAEHICAGTDNDSPDAALISSPLGRTFTNALTAAAIGRRQGLLKVGSCLWTSQWRESAISLSLTPTALVSPSHLPSGQPFVSQNLRKRLAIPPRQTASIHILSSLAHRRFRMRRAPLSTTSAMTVPITKSGYEDPVHATSAPATITPALAITSFAEKI